MQTQLSSYQNKESFYVTQGISKEKIRANEILKKDLKPVINEAAEVKTIDLGKPSRYKRRKTSLNPILSSKQKTSFFALNSTIRDNESNDDKSVFHLPLFINS